MEADNLRFPQCISCLWLPGQQTIDECQKQDSCYAAFGQNVTCVAISNCEYEVCADILGALYASIVDLATICIEELLDVFPRAEWRREWAPQLVLRIAGLNEGLFNSAAGWLAVARRLPRTMRGTQLTTGLAVYVLQHRIDKTPREGTTSENPLKFPIQSGLVVDIVAGVVEDLTQKYVEARKSSKDSKKSPPFDLLCKKVALMDLALQAFLNILTPKEMNIMLGKLDQLVNAHKSTMSAKWHELKTLVSLMHRKYSLENLRVGRDRSVSPPAKTMLSFSDD